MLTDITEAFYYMACVYSRYNARSDWLILGHYLTIRPVKGYGSIAHEAKPSELLTRGP